MSPAAPSGAARRPLVWSSTALDASGPAAGSVRLSWLARLRQHAFTRHFVRHAGDAGVACGAVLAALWTWSVRDGHPLTWQYVVDQAAWIVLAGVWLVLLQVVSGSRAGLSPGDTASVVARAVVVGIGLYLAVYFLAPRDLLPRVVVLNFLALAGIATLVWRVGYRRLFGVDAGKSTVAVVGAGEAARAVAGLLRELAPHQKVLGLFPSRNPRAPSGPDAPPADLRRLVAERQVSALILAPEGPMGTDVLRTVVGAQEREIEVIPMHAVYERLLRRLPIRHREAAWVLESLDDARRRLRSGTWFVKRAVDMLGGGVGCALLLLSLPVLGPLVWLDVGWPVFFRQERLGLAGKPFRVMKFRTMGADAEPEGPRWAEAEDSRASRIGRFLRRSRLDELPQLWNVLRGEMSLVGPRPERPEFVAELVQRIPCYRERLLVRPGISGWAQVNYRYGGSVDSALDKLEYDLYYIKHQGLRLDVVILWRTIWTVLSLGGR